MVLEILFTCKKTGIKRIGAAAGYALAGTALASVLALTVSGENVSLLGKVKNSVVNTQYEKSGDIFTVEKIQLDNGTLSVEGENTGFTAQLAQDSREKEDELSLEKIILLDEKGEKLSGILDMAGLHLEGDFQGITLTAEGSILGFDFGYQDPVEFYAEEGNLYYIDFNGSLLASIPQPQVTGMFYERAVFYWLFRVFVVQTDTKIVYRRLRSRI